MRYLYIGRNPSALQQSGFFIIFFSRHQQPERNMPYSFYADLKVSFSLSAIMAINSELVGLPRCD